MRELIEIEKNNPSLKIEPSPSMTVSGVASATFSEVPHDPPMLSLGNVFSGDELRDFDERCRKNLETAGDIEYCAELKFDGLAVEVIFENGKYVKGSTRGNGIAGEDITANIACIKYIPSALVGKNAPSYLSVRGEAFMRHREFDRLNAVKEKNGEAIFANPRNAAAGSLRQLNPEITKDRELNIVFYAIGKITGGDTVNDQRGMYAFLKKSGLPVSEHVAFGNINDILQFYNHWMENRHNLDFDIDGIVIKINNFRQRDELGFTTKVPKWATAFKFPAKEAITVLNSVDYQVGRTGLITPVANLQPINIGGVLVKRATLHNFDEVRRLGLRIGDSVKVKRAGDVIPKVFDVINDKRPADSADIIPPTKCPSCGSALDREDIYIRCVNPGCIAKRFETLKFFVSKTAMDIDSFGPELVFRLYNSGIVNTIADIFRLTKEDLLKVERMGDKLADKIISSINKRKSVSLSHFLKSIGIRNVGEHIAKVIAQAVISLDTLKNKSIEELSEIYEVGPEAATSVYNFFHDKGNLKILSDILKSGVVVEDEAASEISIESIKNKTFVFTGSLLNFSRKEAGDIVEKYGGRAAGSVSSKTDFVVAGEEVGSKLDKAKKLGVKIITEEEFQKMIGGIE